MTPRKKKPRLRIGAKTNVLKRSYRPSRKSSIRFYLPTAYQRSGLSEYLLKQAVEVEYILSVICWARLVRSCDKRGWTRLKTSYLRRFVPYRRLPGIIKAMRDEKLIDVDRKYRVGVHSRGYRLTDEIASRGFGCVESDDPGVIAKICRIRNDPRPTIPVQKHLLKWYSELEIDSLSARRVVDGAEWADDDTYNRSKNIVDLIASGDHRRHFSCKSLGRIHHAFTLLPRVLRPFCRLAGDELVGTDVSHTQPLLASILPLCDFREACRFAEGSSTKPYDPSAISGHAESLGFSKVSIVCDLSFLVGSGAVAQKQGCDLTDWVRLTSTGKLYEEVTVGIGKQWPIDRELVKRQFAIMVNGDDRQMFPFSTASKIAALCRKRWPTVFSAINRLKKVDHRLACGWMHRAESTLVIGVACESLRLEHPDIPIISLHDAIFSSRMNQPVVESAMRKAFSSVGLSPTFKYENSERPAEVKIA